MMMMILAGDPDRACRVACQDSKISYRFVNFDYDCDDGTDDCNGGTDDCGGNCNCKSVYLDNVSEYTM